MVVGAALHPQAEQELLDAAAYYKREASTEVARAFVKEVRQAIDLLKRQPLIGTPHPGGMRLLTLQRFPYWLVYHAVEKGPPYVYAIAHQRRSPGYWASRTPEGA